MNAKYDFDKGVDVPAAAPRSGVNIDLLRAMPLNTSYWFPKKDEKKVVRFYRVAKKCNCTILVRKVGKEDPRGAGVRMWKTAIGKAAPLDPIAAAERAARKPAKAAARKKKPGGKKGGKPAPKKARGNGAARPKAKRAKKRAAKGVQATGNVGNVETSTQQ